jgi:flagellar biogenesis protein FliO
LTCSVHGRQRARGLNHSISTINAAIVLNPLRSEEEAFRALLYLIAVLAVIVGLVFALRALI